MKVILVATDFSVRSDRAIRRAILTARDYAASLVLTHAVDDDQPSRIVRAERSAAATLLDEQARTIRESDGVDCTPHLVIGDPFEGIAAAAAEMQPDLVVLGPHRRQAMKDVFVGTTAERTIRGSGHPVLMANAVPARPWRHVLIAVDMSDGSREAARTIAALGLDTHAVITVMHAFHAPTPPALARTGATEGAFEAYYEEEAERLRGTLDAYLRDLPIAPASRIVERIVVSPSETIGTVAHSISADLVVLGTRGRSGLARYVLGSVCEAVLRTSSLDVLAIPPRKDASA